MREARKALNVGIDDVVRCVVERKSWREVVEMDLSSHSPNYSSLRTFLLYLLVSFNSVYGEDVRYDESKRRLHMFSFLLLAFFAFLFYSLLSPPPPLPLLSPPPPLPPSPSSPLPSTLTFNTSSSSDCSYLFLFSFPFLVSMFAASFNAIQSYYFHIPLPHHPSRSCIACIEAPHWILFELLFPPIFPLSKLTRPLNFNERYLPAMQSVVVLLMELIMYFTGNLKSWIVVRVARVLWSFDIFILNVCSIGR